MRAEGAAESSGGPPTDARSGAQTLLVTFALAGMEFGVPIEFVKEIVRVPAITRIPMVPSFIEGVANLRGSVLPIINLRDRFRLPAEERTEDNRVVVMEVRGRLTGLVVDQVAEVTRVTDASIEAPPPVVSRVLDAAYLQGVAKLDDGNRLVILLDVDKLLPTSDLTLPSAARGANDDLQPGRVPTGRAADDEEQLVTFTVGGEEYAIAIADVQEIVRVPELTSVPQAPDYIEGVIAWRDRLLPIMNLRTRFRLPAVEIDREDNRIVVVNLAGATTGLLVDTVMEVVSVSKAAIEPTPAIVGSRQAAQLRGVAKLDDGKRLVMLLDTATMLSGGETRGLDGAARGHDSEARPGAPIAPNRQPRVEEQFVSFMIDAEEFGVDIQQVQEIIWMTDITRVPQAPHYVEGLINLRGSVLPVMDIRKRFGMAEVAATDSTSIVVVDVDGARTGVVVDAVREVLRIDSTAIEPPPRVVEGVDRSFVRGVGKRAGSPRMLILLDIRRVVDVHAA